MSTAIELRPFVAADVDAVHQIEVAANEDPWSRSLFADELRIDAGASSDRHWLVATADDTLVAFGGILFVADEVHVMNLAVEPTKQRQGIAARLLAALLTKAGDRGAISATLEVRSSNLAARGLYERFGFSKAGIRPNYYSNGEDAVIMWAHRIYSAEFRQHMSDMGAQQ